MKLLNGEVFNSNEPLAKLMGKEFPVKVSYELAKLANKLNEQFRIIESVRNGLIKKYGAPAEDNPRQIVVQQDGENFEKFVAEVEELMNQEVEIVVRKVILPSEVDGKSIQVEPSVLMALEKFIGVE